MSFPKWPPSINYNNTAKVITNQNQNDEENYEAVNKNQNIKILILLYNIELLSSKGRNCKLLFSLVQT